MKKAVLLTMSIWLLINPVFSQENNGNLRAAPDLIVDKIWTDPALPIAGENVHLYCTIKNIGDAKNTNCALMYFINMAGVGTDQITNNLQPGESNDERLYNYSFATSGTYTYKVLVGACSPAESNTANNEKEISVFVNGKPVISGLPDQFKIGDRGKILLFDLDDYASDPDEANSTLTFTHDDPNKVNITVDPVTHEVFCDPNACWTGEKTKIKITVTDSHGSSASDEFDLRVMRGMQNKWRNVNCGKSEIFEMNNYIWLPGEYTFVFSGDQDWMNVTYEDKRFYCNPAPNQYGSAIITVKVTQNSTGYYDTDTFKLTIGNFAYTKFLDGLTDDVFQLEKDYAININEYISDLNFFPEQRLDLLIDGDKYYTDLHPTIKKFRSQEFKDSLDLWVSRMPDAEWDFIKLETKGGDKILTVKKGYRWDGASDFWAYLNIAGGSWKVRGSCIHDALYDLMRMGYLEHADGQRELINTTGYKNKLLTDLLIYLHFIEQRDMHENTKNIRDFGVLNTRNTAYENTNNDGLLEHWKYRVGKLRAYTSDGRIELIWQPADLAGTDPSNYNDNAHLYQVWRDGAVIDHVTYTPGDSVSVYLDEMVTNDQMYYYEIKSPSSASDFDYSYSEHATPVVKQGKALSFDGVNDYVESYSVPYSLIDGPLTMEAWASPEKTGKGYIISFNSTFGGNFNLLGYDGSTQKFIYYDTEHTSYVYSTDTFPPNIWYHVAVSIDNTNTAIMWVNGVEQARFTTSIRPAIDALFSVGQEWDSGNATDHYKGKIDEVRIWNTARTQAQIQEKMYTPLYGNEPELVLCWHFDETWPVNLPVPFTFNANKNANTGILHGPVYVSSGAMDSPILVNSIQPAPGPVTINENEKIDFLLSAYDPDGNPLEYSWKVDGAEVSTDSGYSFTTDFTSAGTYTVTLDVTDNFSSTGNSRSTLAFTWTVTVTDVDQVIIVNDIQPAPGPVTITDSETITFLFSGYDPDSNPLVYSWKVNGAEVATDSSYLFTMAGGIYPVALDVTDNFKRNSLHYDWNITVIAAPEVPVLISPAIGATGVSLNPTLTWNATSNATTYGLQVSTTSDFSNLVVYQINLIDSCYTPIGKLTNNTLYYWRVNAANIAGISAWTPVWNFTTDNPVNTIDIPDKKPKNFLFTAHPSIADNSRNSIDFYYESDIGFEGVLTLYDCTGNVIFTSERTLQSTKDVSLFEQWDLINRSGRIVADGTYLAVFKIRTDDGETELLKMKIGVKRD